MTTSQRRRRHEGFTLVVVLLVLVILVVMATVTVIAIGPAQERAYINTAKTQIAAFETPLDMYRLDLGDFPLELEALREAPSDLEDPDDWGGPYLRKAIGEDPWKNPYQYAWPGNYNTELPDIWSWGPDGIADTDDDIGNWDEG